MNPDDLILISVDDHIAEPATMFEAHVPQKYRDRMPRVVTDERGRQKWWYGDLPGRMLGLNAVAGKPREKYNIDAARYDEMRPGCWDVHERVRDMSAGGQLAGLNFPNWTGFAGQVLNQGPDRDTNLVMIKAYNDWHIDEWCGTYPDRFIPCGIIPLFDADLAAEEIKRLAAKGCYAVTFSENPTAYDLPSINTDYWDPLFGACSDEGTVLCLHLGSSGRNVQISPDAPASVPMTLSAATTVNTLIELVWADFWYRFPNLKMSLTEGDIGWIPYFLQRAEHILDRHSGWTRHEFPTGYSPTAIFLERILVCFINDPVGVALLDRFNVDNVCWESDYPHSDSAWPFGPEVVAEMLEGLPEEQVRKITHENAMRHYHFDPFSTRAREKCTAGALRAEAPDVDVITHVGNRPDDDEAEIFMVERGLRPTPTR
ncbi:MAG: amidohydrolase family protein [Acidimicrobiales bacterium]